jgi:hypothetical protein
VQALLELPDEHESSAGIVARVLYEHVTLFSWLAIDPPTNLPQWVRHDRVERLKVHNDLARFGRPVLSPGGEEPILPAAALMPALDAARRRRLLHCPYPAATMLA